MARNINGGTDRISFLGNLDNVGSADQIAATFRMRTTQATVNALVCQRWNFASAGGFALIINNTANKLTLVANDGGGTQRLILTGATSVNTGSWIDVVANMNTASGQPSEIFVNGASQGTANSSGNWTTGSTQELLFGDSTDAFWPSYVGDIADVGFWHGALLSADEVAAYHAGYGPCHIRPALLQVDAPLFRDVICRRGNTGTVVGTTVADHPRVYA